MLFRSKRGNLPLILICTYIYRMGFWKDDIMESMKSMKRYVIMKKYDIMETDNIMEKLYVELDIPQETLTKTAMNKEGK